MVPGHEITGTAVRVGARVTSIAPGDFVGVGAQAWSCGACTACAGEGVGVNGVDHGPLGEHGHGGAGGLAGGRENYCKDVVETYNWRYKDGSLAYGGYANYTRVHENFVYPLPADVPPEVVAPMLCGGVTMYSPLVRAGVGPGSKVGIVGIGGLGHFGVLFAVALGADVTAISHSPRKRADALKMGAATFIATQEPGWSAANARSLDIVISTNFSQDMPLGDYLGLLKVGGTLVVCGIPEGNLPPLAWADVGAANLSIRGSNVGSKQEILDMLRLVQEKKIRSWVEIVPMKEAAETVRKMDRGEARYRYVLKADIES